MPSATEYFGFAVTNLGPLTTTFTAAPSCATASNAVYFANTNDAYAYRGRPTCSLVPYGNDCYPSGEELDSLISDIYFTPTQGFAHYFSPGIACPSGWTTAGAVAHVTATPAAGSSDGDDAFSRSGVFTEDPWGWYREYTADEAVLPKALVYLDALDAAETLAYCCPSGYAADIQGTCSSSLGPLTSYDYSEKCMLYFGASVYVTASTLTEPSWTFNLLSVTDPGFEVATRTETISTSSWGGDQLIVATQIPAVVLVYQASDLPTSGDASSSGSSILPGLLLPLWILIGVVTGVGMIIHS
ncbi:hypothetical protein F5X99DRAFT_128994 [Biscogniauxia marginata]|nr:hypothetical protein F5X99DRAFT_128994 [Biscogniauxia marginata]